LLLCVSGWNGGSCTSTNTSHHSSYGTQQYRHCSLLTKWRHTIYKHNGTAQTLHLGIASLSVAAQAAEKSCKFIFCWTQHHAFRIFSRRCT